MNEYINMNNDHSPYIKAFFGHALFVAKRDELILENCIFDILKYLIGQPFEEIEYRKYTEDVFDYARMISEAYNLEFDQEVPNIRNRVVGVICGMIELLHERGKNDRAESLKNRLFQTAKIEFQHSSN